MIRHNQPGMDAEVDFGEAWVDLAGERTKCFVFALRLVYSGKAVHHITTSCGQEAFLDGHVDWSRQAPSFDCCLPSTASGTVITRRPMAHAPAVVRKVEPGRVTKRSGGCHFLAAPGSPLMDSW
ncbi:hypothetical protein [Streptomyces sp. NPDC091294]|uniref:hypothetical protein n=1 Tax=Streptomyces sp. NPDC091294 TaxID=3365992 RepID=UPI0037F707D7